MRSTHKIMESGRLFIVENNGTLKLMSEDANYKTVEDGKGKGKPPMHVIFTRTAQENIKKQLRNTGSRFLYTRSDSVNINDHMVYRGSLHGKVGRETTKTVDVRIWKR